MDKNGIIIVAKLKSEVNTRQSPSHGLRRSTCVDLGQNKDKNSYYHSFKTLLRGRPVARLGSQVEKVKPG